VVPAVPVAVPVPAVPVDVPVVPALPVDVPVVPALPVEVPVVPALPVDVPVVPACPVEVPVDPAVPVATVVSPAQPTNIKSAAETAVVVISANDFIDAPPGSEPQGFSRAGVVPHGAGRLAVGSGCPNVLV
jgi:hypothetical protein